MRRPASPSGGWIYRAESFRISLQHWVGAGWPWHVCRGWLPIVTPEMS
ncbi:hypothetical protein HMPREF0731_3471 [Pseudoroseomonas cervicalis ATCC 49957]|uniref:Uncharacterized protein n=1 Tax=Pseudoroseomonas cervicalis ATCC 49957 TaxID=525371 RepID=D5RQV9_9PROT|nr:hypothetical protein HMPREF0731_3471 [Pseudoroseomonas cervicalis ATCC 49957]